MKITEQTFEKMKFGMYQRVSYEFLKNAELHIVEEHLTNTFIVQMNNYILGQHNRQKYSIGIEVPKNLWQHIREVVLPSWWLRHFPVKTKVLFRTVEFDHMALCPNLKLPPDQGPVIMHTPRPSEPNVNPEKE